MLSTEYGWWPIAIRTVSCSADKLLNLGFETAHPPNIELESTDTGRSYEAEGLRSMVVG